MRNRKKFAVLLTMLFLAGCSSDAPADFSGLKVELRVGSALGDFCKAAIAKFNAQSPKLANGTAFQATCNPQGSGDVVTSVATLATQLKAGTIKADDPQFPTLIALDGEIYQSQLIYQVDQLFPGQNYIPAITDAPLIANSPMVLMAQPDVAAGLQKVADPYKALVTAKTHKDIDPAGPALTVHYVQTAPTRSNSGLQTLVAQFASVSGKRPEELTVGDVQRYQADIQKVQSKVTRYGASTNSLAKAMVKNGPYWATVGSVYESSVIAANSTLPTDQTRYQAVYPKSTFSSNMRMIVPNAPWVSADEKAAAQQIIDFLRTPETQKIATDLGLRPGVPGVPLGDKFTAAYGVLPEPKYDSYRPPSPAVVSAMLTSWQSFAKKPSLVVVVVDSSGSMEGEKMAAVQRTLQTYVNSLGPKDQIALIDFDTTIREPVLIDGTPQGRAKGQEFISSLQAEGGTGLYDAALYARNWLHSHLRKEAINAVLILTDGNDDGSSISLDNLGEELKKSGFTTDERISFFTVGYGNDGDFNKNALTQIAELNGGYFAPGNPETISRLMADLQVEF
jgi:Ca-activated chloride channel homolog